MATEVKAPSKSTARRGYPDLHDHLKSLEDAGLVRTIDVPATMAPSGSEYLVPK